MVFFSSLILLLLCLDQPISFFWQGRCVYHWGWGEGNSMTKLNRFPTTLTAQKMKFPIWSHLLKKSLMENFIFCAASIFSIMCCQSWLKHSRSWVNRHFTFNFLSPCTKEERQWCSEEILQYIEAPRSNKHCSTFEILLQQENEISH